MAKKPDVVSSVFDVDRHRRSLAGQLEVINDLADAMKKVELALSIKLELRALPLDPPPEVSVYKPKRKFSAATKAKMSESQRARWRKPRKDKKSPRRK